MKEQVKVNGVIKVCPQGFFWCIIATLVATKEQIQLDSSMTGDFYGSKDEAKEEMKYVGRELVKEFARLFREASPDCNPQIIKNFNALKKE